MKDVIAYAPDIVGVERMFLIALKVPVDSADVPVNAPDSVKLLDLDSRIGTGRAAGVEDFKVKTATPFPLHHFRYYHGARLVNQAGTAEYRIVEARDKTAVFLDPAAHPEATAARLAAEFPDGAWFDIYDYGVGDEVIWPSSASLTWEQSEEE